MNIGDNMAKKYQYTVIYDYFKDKIENGYYKPGDLLPPEPELERMFSVSRTTVRKAVDLLSREGFLKAQQGRGTVVTDNKTMQNLNYVTSTSETLTNKGYISKPKNIYIDTIPADKFISSHLNVDEGTSVIRIQRIQLANNDPIAILKNFFEIDAVPNIIKKQHKIKSVYSFLESEYGINIDSATEHISAKNATFEESQMLNIPVGSALIDMKRMTYSGGKPISVEYSHIIGNKYELTVNMAGRKKK